MLLKEYYWRYNSILWQNYSLYNNMLEMNVAHTTSSPSLKNKLSNSLSLIQRIVTFLIWFIACAQFSDIILFRNQRLIHLQLHKTSYAILEWYIFVTCDARLFYSQSFKKKRLFQKRNRNNHSKWWISRILPL